ncbi:ATP-dependent RNA helicase DEAH11 [Colletotrichum sp. SAR 10_65]|nr:ATP-dependent RNA helicase DEAH11 [Colletotrichum sp. SAR 10_65]
MSSTTMIANRTSIIPANGSVVRHKLGVDMTITAGGEVTGFELTDATNKTLIWTGCASTVEISWPKDGVRTVAYQYERLLSHLQQFMNIIHYTRPEESNLRYIVKITLENSDQAAMAVKHLAHLHLKDFRFYQAFEARIGVPHDQMSTISNRFNELNVLALHDNVSTEVQRSATMAIITVTGYNRLAVTNMKRQLDELIAQSAILDTTTIRAPKIQSERTCMACFDVLERPVLPSCGHQSLFCAECLLETYRANHKKGPLRCTEQNDNGELCSQPIDLECLANNLPPALFEDFLDLAANAFVARNPNLVRHCPTPGCRQIYQPTPKTEDSMGTPKTCPDCLVRLCTTCGHQHDNDSPSYNHMVKDHGTVGEGYIAFDDNGDPILPEDERIENELAELQLPVDDEDLEPAQDDGRDRDHEWTEYKLAEQEYLDDNKYYPDKDQYEEYGMRLEPTQDNS